MKIDANKEIKKFDGTPVLQGDIPLKLGRACSQALAEALEEDRKLGAEKTLARWKLATALYSAEGEFDLTPEQAAEIRGRVPQVFTLVVAGQIIEALK